MVESKKNSLKEMVEVNLDIARKMREDGNEVEAMLSVKSSDGKVQVARVGVLTDDKERLSRFLKSVGAHPDTEAIVFMSEAWITKVDKTTNLPRPASEREEIVNILAESANGEGYQVMVPIKDGKLGEPEWQKIDKTTEYRGRLANFFSEREKENKDWQFYIQ